MENFKIKTNDGVEIACYLWAQVEKPKAIIQLSHGMAEHLRRYDNFAKFLNKNGFIVVGDDHRGHGYTSGKENLGKTEKTIFYDTVNDVIQLGKQIKTKYNLPLILIGHSYGSFLSQAIIEESDQYDLCVLVGSARQDGPEMRLAKIVTFVQNMFCGGKKQAKMLTKLGFEGCNKPFKNEKLLNSWLSKDTKNVVMYNNDSECGFMFDINFYYSLSRACINMYKKCNLNKINKNIPILVTSGSNDPVGKMGKSTTALYNMYKKLGIKTVELKFYEEKRHEILNDLDNEKVYGDIISFINKNISK